MKRYIYIILGIALIMNSSGWADSLLPLSKLPDSAQTVHAKSLGSPWLSSRLLTPHLTVKDVQQSKAFYEAALGFKLRYEQAKAGEIQHVEMSYHDELVLMFVPENVRDINTLAPISFVDPQQQTAYFYLYVDSVDDTFERAMKAGAHKIVAPYDAPWGDRFAIFADINGYHWGIAEMATTQKK